MFDQAAEDYRHALELATEMGLRPHIAHVRVGLGKLHAKTGEQREAERHFAAAMELYRSMGMQFWLEQVEVEARGPA